ncbi:hypothetical protein RIF29_45480 [Crotalaria pallida]|uniref:Uncharacterized protein n=1 Tax=Crotalaria pallida TaxID=3830 RepID=A0AAN9E081_CROPI
MAGCSTFQGSLIFLYKHRSDLCVTNGFIHYRVGFGLGFIMKSGSLLLCFEDLGYVGDLLLRLIPLLLLQLL